MKKSIIMTVLAVIMYHFASYFIGAASPVIAGNLSVSQLTDTNAGFANTILARQFDGNGLPVIILIAVLACIWIPFLISMFKESPKVVTMLCILGCFTLNANAFYNERNDVEQITIKSNQTAFMIPMQGANLKNQGTFDSAAFLDANKVPTKRVEIPHCLLPKTGILVRDVYIPASQLVIVTREPFARCWTKDANRGTSKENQGFFVESKEGIDIDCGISIAACIQLKDSATYLYNFGISDKVMAQDQQFPDFASVVYAKDLSTIMDTVVHQDVQRLLSREFGKRAMTDAINQKFEIMQAVSDELVKTYAELGITIRYIGFATPLNFDSKIQDAIDGAFIAKKNADSAADRMTAMPVLMALADIEIKKGIAQAIGRWNGQISLPSFLLMSDQLTNTLGSFFGTNITPTKQVTK